MQHRLPPSPMTPTSMHTTKTPAHLLASDAETTPNQRSEQEDQPECQGIEDTERRHWLYKKAHAQQPSAGSLTSSNSSSSGGSSSDGDDVDEMALQDQPVGLSRSSLMARRWGQASSARSEKAAAGAEEQADSPSKPRPQAVYVMNKARDLCARIRHQAKVKQREERKRILLQRQVARDFARQEAREAAVQESAAQWELEREKMQAHESQADNFHALQLARQAIRKWQASVQHAKALRQEQQEREERLHQAAKMERLREGVLLWDRWAKQRAVFIWYVKAQHMSKLEQQQQQKQQQQQREEEEKKARAAAAAAAAAAASAVLAPSFSSFAGWFFQAGKWVKWQVDRACAPPRRSKSPAYYLDEC